jgi:hypothetical protein
MGPGLWMDGSGRNKLDGTQLFSPAPHLFFWLSRRARTLPVRFPSIAGGVNDNNINGFSLCVALCGSKRNTISSDRGVLVRGWDGKTPPHTHDAPLISHTLQSHEQDHGDGYHSHHYEYAFYVIHLLVSLR